MKKRNIIENLEFEVEPEEVSLKSFRIKDYLENHIWNEDGMLDLKVRRALLDISDDFWVSCGISWIKPKTVLLTGSICNFNWSNFSDVDIHVVVDFSEIHERKDFVQEYFNEKKNDWNNRHKGLNVYGYPVEMYVEDVNTETKSEDVYDLWENKWLKEPKGFKPIKLNKYAIKQISSEIMTEIDNLCEEFEKEEDMHKVELIGDSAEKLARKIKAIRKTGLNDDEGEMSNGSIVYKTLRRTEYLDKLWKLIDDVYDKVNSVDKEKQFNEKVSEMFQ